MSSKAPPAPNYAESSREAIKADIDNLPIRYQTELEYRPKFDALDAEQAARTASALAKAQYENELAYGPKFLDQAMANLEKVDPEGIAARRKMSDIVMQDVSAGSSLTPAEAREIEQAYRGAQTARGNILSPAAAVAETIGKGQYGQQLKQQRLANLGSFISGTSPQGQFGLISQAQQGAAPFNPRTNSVIDNAGVQSAAQAIYGAKQQTYQAALSKPNPWAQGLGAAAGIAGAMMI